MLFSEMDNEKCVTLALFQGRARNGDVRFNLKKIEEQTKRAAATGAELIIFPELFLSGYGVPAEEMKNVAEERDGPSFQELSKTADESNIAVLYGYPEVDRSSGRKVFYNSAQLIDKDGNSLANYRKTHLWIPPEPPRFEKVFTLGSHLLEPVDCCGIKIGIIICMDLSLPECARSLALAGAQLIAVPTASSTKWSMSNIKMLPPVRAVENSVYVAYVNHVDNGMRGESMCCDPNGEVLAFSGSNSAEALLLATLELSLKPLYRTITSRRPELYKNLVQIGN